MLTRLLDTAYYTFPFGRTRVRHNHVAPYSPYVKYALGKAPEPHTANIPLDTVLRYWKAGDVDNAYRLINNHMWMDKVKTTPKPEDQKWMDKVHEQKVNNWFNVVPVDTNLPRPSTPQQEKMLPWVTSTKTNRTSKVASTSPGIATSAIISLLLYR